jgi:predicted nuclease with TOPRIM domain
MTQPPAFDLWQFLAAVLPSLGIGAMVGGIIVAFIKRGTDKEANNISEKDVNTRAATMGLEVLTEGLAELRTEQKEARERLKDQGATLEAQSLQIQLQEVKLSAQHDKIEKLRSEVVEMREERKEMIEHIQILEQGYPNPPGAPQRPHAWGNTSLA